MKILTQLSLFVAILVATSFLASAQIAPSGIFRESPTPLPTATPEPKSSPATTPVPTPTATPTPVAQATVQTPTAPAETPTSTPSPVKSHEPVATPTPKSTATPTATPAPAVAREEVPAARTSGSAVSKLEQLEREWGAASNDAATIDKMLADDFIGVSSAGAVVTKKTMLRAARNAKDSASSVGDMEVRLHGSNLAIVVGTANETGSGGGRRSSYRFTDTWAMRDGRWQCIASHVTSLSRSGNRETVPSQRYQTGSHLPRPGQ